MNAWQFLIELNKMCQFHSIENPKKKASNSELKRWLQNNAVECNGEKLKHDEIMDFAIFSLVLFPKKKKTTLF